MQSEDWQQGTTTRRLGTLICWIALVLTPGCTPTDPAAPTADLPATPAAFVRFDPAQPVETHGRGLPWLSDYGFFTGPLSELNPAEHVEPYSVGAPLFSDYAGKARFVYFPDGHPATYHPTEVFDFPEGTVIIKNFFYDDYGTEADAPPARRLLETRLLVRTAEAWEPRSYVWDEAQTDARFTLLGAELPVAWTDAEGRSRTHGYRVPDINQCKSCHAYERAVRPIGPTARQLNHDGLLDDWAGRGLLLAAAEPAERPEPLSYAALPPGHDLAPTEPRTRARAYLDANCGHCHRPEGSAKTSGLDLSVFADNPYELGVRKPPVAAGRASGDLQYSIVPGRPDESILLYRMQSNDPAVAMPEVGRGLVHEEGVELIREWIAAMTSK